MQRLIFVLSLMATPALADDCGLYEAIEPGDTILGIAARCETTSDAIFAANPGIDAADLPIGGVLRLVTNATDSSVEARATYESVFLGAYAPSDICSGQEFQVFLEPDRILTGETSCQIADINIAEGSLIIDLTACQSEGEPSEDRTVQLTRLPGRAMEYVFGGSAIRLERCTDY